ncbi:hypothetical protein FOCC_FOCC004738 [Frankliniella occidentalis]|nr:hypothetical protein FOCC_FOCC004738 [Frankliniella occidentalis]
MKRIHLKIQKLLAKSPQDNSVIQVQKTATDEAVFAMLKKMVGKDKKGEKGFTDPHLRAFALTMHYYSPAGYRYLRRKFKESLPSDCTLSRWYSTMDGDAGFTPSSFDALKRLSENKGKKLVVALMVDDMAIRRRVNVVGTNVTGFPDLGKDHRHLLKKRKQKKKTADGAPAVSDERPPLAKEVCVFMVVCLDQSAKIPVGYFLHDKLSGPTLAALVSDCMKKLHSVGAVVKAIVTDGNAANLKMAKCLGADLEPVKRVYSATPGDMGSLVLSDKFQPYFFHPSDSTVKVYYILDVCHMLKLVRNALGARKKILDVNNNLVSWDHIDQLHRTQMQEGLRLCNKLTDRHIKWYENKQKVSFAGQTLSNSVATALKFCEKLPNRPEFQRASVTARYCSIFNNLFDVFNSCTLAQKFGLIKPMSLGNEAIWNAALEEGKNYILGLIIKEKGQTVFNSVFEDDRKVGFQGFLIAIESIRGLFNDLVRNGPMTFLLTNKLSQDHLESFFGKTRQMRGPDNNPSAKHFKDSYRRLLLGAEISVSKSANCMPLEYIPILNANKVNRSLNTDALRKKRQKEEERYKCVNSFVCLGDHFANQNFPNTATLLSDFSVAVVSYVGGFVAKKLAYQFNCFLCEAALISEFGMANSGDFVNFIAFKTIHADGLTVPSKDVVNICAITESNIRKKNGTHFKQLFELKKTSLDIPTVLQD